MIKRTLYFGNDVYLHTKDEQLIADFAVKENKSAKTNDYDEIISENELDIIKDFVNKI